MTSPYLITRPHCANTEIASSNGRSQCSEVAPNICNGCFLVQVGAPAVCSPLTDISMEQYCGKVCQQAHWSVHKVDCKSSLIKASWRPSWDVENRRPAFMAGDDSPFLDHTSHGRQVYLWGNVPALDVIKLQHNEGVDFAGNLRLLFAGEDYLVRLYKTLTPPQRPEI